MIVDLGPANGNYDGAARLVSRLFALGEKANLVIIRLGREKGNCADGEIDENPVQRTRGDNPIASQSVIESRWRRWKS